MKYCAVYTLLIPVNYGHTSTTLEGPCFVALNLDWRERLLTLTGSCPRHRPSEEYLCLAVTDCSGFPEMFFLREISYAF